MNKKIAVVTGAARGIGLEISKILAENDCHVVMLDLNESLLNEEVKKLEESNLSVTGLGKIDISSSESVSQAFEHIRKEIGEVSILVNNAGVYPHISFEDMDYDSWSKLIKINLDSVYLCCKEVFSGMKEQGFGRIVNLSSAVVFTGIPNVSAYAAAKSGVIGLTRILATEGGAFGITANTVAPGLIETEGVLEAINGHFDEVLVTQSIKRRGQKADIAEMVAYLCSDKSGFITGQTIGVNGGSYYQ